MKGHAGLGRPLGTGRDWRRRLLLHHLPLALAGALLLVGFVYLPPFNAGGHGRTSLSRLTTATGYVALWLLGLTLLVGPANLLLRRHNPSRAPCAGTSAPGRPPSAPST